MTRRDFLRYNDQPCRFRMKSGKVVFGVIWEQETATGFQYCFASLQERFGPPKNGSGMGMNISLEEIIAAEPLPLADVLAG